MVFANKTKQVLVPAVLLTLISGCASLNPFAKSQPEDLNALTYGNDYDNGRASDGTWSSSSRDDSNSAFGSRAPSSAPNAAPAEDKPSYYGQDKQDPTDDSVRQDIEKSRGYANSGSGFARGDRATRADFQDNTPNDGSLWANENDSNYFFTKGKVRTNGDIISVKLEDPMIKQFAEEIKKSLTPAEQEVEMAIYRRNDAAAKDDADLKAYRNVASDDLKTSDANDVKTRMEKAVRWSQVDLTKVIGFTPNEELRAEIIDRYANGNFKIRAVKRVLYRGSSKLVSMVGVAPANDFDDKDLIASGKLYEYKIKVAR